MTIKLTPLAFKLWRLITERRGHYMVDEVTRELGVSKTKLGQAIAELEEKGLVSPYIEEV